MDSNAFKGIDTAFKVLGITCLIAVPLALWKLVDIVVWIASRIEVRWL